MVMFLVVVIATVITIQHVLYSKVTIVTVDPTQSGAGQKSDTSAILTVPDSTTTDHVPGGIINMGYSKETFQIVGKE